MVRLGRSTAVYGEDHFRLRHDARTTEYGFAAVALYSTTGKCLVSSTLRYVSISLLFTSQFKRFFHCLNSLVCR